MLNVVAYCTLAVNMMMLIALLVGSSKINSDVRVSQIVGVSLPYLLSTALALMVVLK